jgi:hypothetical protein
VGRNARKDFDPFRRGGAGDPAVPRRLHVHEPGRLYRGGAGGA